MTASALAWTSVAIGAWSVGNGILHDIVVISEHKDGYSRHLLYLLLNGNIIILSGVLELIAFPGIRDNLQWGLLVSGIASFSMVIYCIMIWQFLKSIVTLILQTGLLIAIILHCFSLLFVP